MCSSFPAWINCTVIRTRSPERETDPSTMPSTFNSRAISGSDFWVSLYRMLEVREITRKARNCAKSVTSASGCGRWVQTYEHIARKEWCVDCLSTIAPEMNCFQHRKERLHPFVLKLSRHLSFKPVPCLDRVPSSHPENLWLQTVRDRCHWSDSSQVIALPSESHSVFDLFSTVRTDQFANR